MGQACQAGMSFISDTAQREVAASNTGHTQITPSQTYFGAS
jgi:hypothetical protein